MEGGDVERARERGDLCRTSERKSVKCLIPLSALGGGASVCLGARSFLKLLLRLGLLVSEVVEWLFLGVCREAKEG